MIGFGIAVYFVIGLVWMSLNTTWVESVGPVAYDFPALAVLLYLIHLFLWPVYLAKLLWNWHA
jgi:hypothetical protein